MSEMGIKESIYNQLRAEGYSPLEAMELVDIRYESFIKDLNSP